MAVDGQQRIPAILSFIEPRELALDSVLDLEVPAAVRSLKIRPVQTSLESPWQNGVAERWVESCRRDLLDHVIVVNAKGDRSF